MPIINSLKPGVSKLVLAEMQKVGVRGTKEQIQVAHGKRVEQLVSRRMFLSSQSNDIQLTTRRKQLFSEYRCSPGLTIAIPIITQVPLFMGFSIVLNRLSQAPTPFDSESFLTLSTLAHADPTATLPIALGLITLANVESSRWFMTDTQRERQEKVQKWKEGRVARGETVIEPQKIIKSVLRLISVGRIVVATMVPGVSMSSAGFTY
jgi:inner membrane protein COX18